MVQLTPSNTSVVFRVALAPYESKRRMAPSDNYTIASKESNKLLSCFTKYCCCCCPKFNETQQNQLAVHIYEQYLKQEYGDLSALLSARMANIDLTEKKENGSPLYTTEAQAILQDASMLRDNLPFLKQMIKHLAFYQEFQKFKESLKEEKETKNLTLIKNTSPPDLERKPSTAYKRCSVHKRNNRVEGFDQDKIKKDLAELPLNNPISPNDIYEIVSQMKKSMIAEQIEQVSSDQIRSYLVAGLAERGYAVKRPEFLDLVTNHNLAQSLLKKKALDELIGEECKILLAQAEVYMSYTLSEYPNNKLQYDDKQPDSADFDEVSLG